MRQFGFYNNKSNPKRIVLSGNNMEFVVFSQS